MELVFESDVKVDPETVWKCRCVDFCFAAEPIAWILAVLKKGEYTFA